MAFDLNTAKPTDSGFELSSAKPVDALAPEGDVLPEAPPQKTLMARILGVPDEAYELSASDRKPFPGVGAIKEMVTGEGRRTPETERLPEFKAGMVFGPTDPRSAQIGSRLLAIEDEEELAGSLSEFGIASRYDSKGNIIVEWQNPSTGLREEAVLNQPGLSTKDITTGVAQAVPEFLTGRFAAGKTAGKGLLKRGAAQMGAQALATGAREGIQQQLGGEYNLEDVLVDTVIAGGMEGLGDLASYGIKKLSEKGRQFLADKKSIMGMIDAGMDKEGLKRLSRRLVLDEKIAQEMGLTQALPAASAAVGKKSYQQPLADLVIAARENPKYANILESRIAQSSKDAQGALEDTLIRMGNPDDISAVSGIKQTLTDLAEKPVNDRRLVAKLAYGEAFKDVPDVKVAALDRQVGNLVALADGDSKLQPRLKSLRKSLTTADYTRKLADYNKAKTADPLMPPSGLEKPAQEISIGDMQSVDQELGDLLEVAIREKNTKVANAIRTTRAQVNAQMNAVTGGSYGKAKATYERMSRIVDKVMGSDIGKGAEAGERTLAGFLEKLFNPSELTVGASREFIREIKNADPQAARDLLSSYVSSKLAKAQAGKTAEAVAPSDILSEVFSGEILKTAVSVDPKSAMRLAKIKKYLEKFALLEGVDPQKAAQLVTEQRLDKGVLGALSEFIGTPGTFIRKSGGSGARKENVQALFDAAMNPQWAARMDEILSMPQLSEEAYEAAGNFMEQVLAWNERRSFQRQTAQELMGLSDQLIESQAEGEKEGPLFEAKELPNPKGI